MSSLDIGMSPVEVVKRLGQPNGKKAVGNYIHYYYNNKLTSGWSWDRADYHVIFNEGKVVEFGQGQVRQKGNTLFLMHLN